MMVTLVRAQRNPYILFLSKYLAFLLLPNIDVNIHIKKSNQGKGLTFSLKIFSQFTSMDDLNIIEP